MAKWIAIDNMNQDFSQWGILTLDSDGDLNINTWSFLRELENKEIVDKIFGFNLLGMQDEGLSELTRMQNRTAAKKETMLDESTVYVYLADSISLLETDEVISEDILKKYNQKEDYLLFLGDTYRQIEIGTEYNSSLAENRRYIVAGYLPKDDVFFSENILRDDEVWNVNLVNSLNDMIVMVSQDMLPQSSKQMFFVKDGVTSKIMKEMQEIANSYHVRITVTKLDTIYTRNNRSGNNEVLYALPYFIAILLATIVIIISYYLLDVLGNRKKYGVYYAVGFQKENIRYLLFCENVIRIVIAVGLSQIIFYKFFRFVYPDGYVLSKIENVLFIFSFAGVFVMAIFVGCICIYIPYKVLQGFTTNELMREMDI